MREFSREECHLACRLGDIDGLEFVDHIYGISERMAVYRCLVTGEYIGFRSEIMYDYGVDDNDPNEHPTMRVGTPCILEPRTPTKIPIVWAEKKGIEQ